jgi:hypothetical protein
MRRSLGSQRCRSRDSRPPGPTAAGLLFLLGARRQHREPRPLGGVARGPELGAGLRAPARPPEGSAELDVRAHRLERVVGAGDEVKRLTQESDGPLSA